MSDENKPNLNRNSLQPDTPHTDTQDPDTPHLDTSQANPQQSDTPQRDTPEPHTQQRDTALDTQHPETPQPDASRLDLTQHDTPQPNKPQLDTPTADSSANYEETFQDASNSRSPRKKLSADLDIPNVDLSDIELDADIIEVVLFYVGEMGIYQKWLFIWMMPFATFFAWTYFGQMFLTLTPPNFWCKVPELANLSMLLRRNLSAPGATEGIWDSCHTYDTNWTKVMLTLEPPPENTTKVPCKYGWEFEHGNIPYDTVVSERGWVCDSAGYVPTTHSLFFAGSIAGGIIFGWMADNMGRVPALIGVNLIGGIGGVATIFTKGVWDFIFCRFLVGMAFDNCFMIIYILVLEYVGPSHRTWMANLPLAIYYGSAAVGLPWIAYYLADWRKFVLVTSLPMFIVLLAPWVMPESARWLVSRGKVDKAVEVLKNFAKVNRNHIPPHILNQFIETSVKVSEKNRESILLMFKNRLIRTTVIFMIFVYCGLAVVYDALVRLSESFGMNVFITFTINAAAEIPSILVLTMLLDRLGRRNLTWGPMVTAALFMLIAMLVPEGIAQVTFAVLARFLINLSFAVSIQWATEIIPTPFRATGSSALHICGFIISLLSPFIVFLHRYWSSLPLLLLIITSLISAILSLLLPETKGQEMPQTIADAEKIIWDGSLRGKPEVQDLKRALSSVLTTAISEPIHRSKEGRVSRMLITQSKSRLNIQS